MDEIQTLAENISSILPNRTPTPNDRFDSGDRTKSAYEKAKTLIREKAESKMRKEEKILERKEKAYAERMQKQEAKKQEAERQEAYVADVLKYDADMRVKQTLDSQDKYFPQLDNLAPQAQQAQQSSSPAQVVQVDQAPKVSAPRSPQAILAQEFGMPTAKPEVLKLLASLNVNLNMQLSKNDTANLLACLLTCNEQQLAAIYSNPRIPIAIKIVIKRLQDDLKIGSMTTIEKLWDRVFGKGDMTVNIPQETMQGIIPNTPISREAYIVIRDTLIK